MANAEITDSDIIQEYKDQVDARTQRKVRVRTLRSSRNSRQKAVTSFVFTTDLMARG